MKNKLLIFIALLMIAVMVSGCGSQAVDETVPEEGIRIVATIFPEYDWAKEILGDDPGNAELILLTDNGADLHSYQASAEDIMDITTCDVLIYVGGESDSFIGDALRNSVNDEMKTVDLMEVLGDSVREEELAEGMEGEAEDPEEPEYDEHVWLSLKNASVLCEAICDAICAADPENEEYYRDNLDKYKAELAALDSDYEAVIGTAERNVLLFGDRYPFRYLSDDYGLEYYAAFPGCSSESEASFETITFLAGKVDELGLGHVMTIENSDGKIAQAVIENTKEKDQKITALDSMQSVTAKDIEEGISYIQVMKDDLEVLREVLN